MDADYNKTERHAATQRMYQQYDPRSLGVIHALEEVYPAFARKLFEGAPLMRNLVMSNYNPMDILEYPVCGRCETVSVSYQSQKDRMGFEHETCKCFKCGNVTVDPILVRDWLVIELKRRVPQEYIEMMDWAVDEIAQSMLYKQKRQFNLLQADIERSRTYATPESVHDGVATNEIKKEALNG